MNFEDMYRTHHADVRRFALYLTGDAAAADDIASETFVRAWAADAPLQAVSLRAYLLTIARNLHRRSFRRRRHEPIGAELADPEPGPEARLAAKRALYSVMDRLQSIAEIDRAAVLMRAFHGLAYEEIARALGISVSSAKVKVHRARATLSATQDERSQP
jgi:RNA polymerase sigma-70 factor (ECF subfamily)